MPRKVPLPFALATAAAAQSMWEEQEKRPCYYATRTISPHAIDDFCSYENPKKKSFWPHFCWYATETSGGGGGGGMRPQPVFVLLVSTSCCGEPELLLHFVSSPLRPPLSSLHCASCTTSLFVTHSALTFLQKGIRLNTFHFFFCAAAKNAICHNCYVDHPFVGCAIL